MKEKSMNEIKSENIKRTEVAIPKEATPHFYRALKEYCKITDHEFAEPPKRKGTQNFSDNSGSIDEWYIDLKEFRFSDRSLNYNDLVHMGNFWSDVEKGNSNSWKMINKISLQNIKPTEIVIPRASIQYFIDAVKEYSNLEHDEFVDPPKREEKQNLIDHSISIDVVYVDLKDFRCDRKKLKFDDLVWIGSFWSCRERSERKKIK